MPISKARIEKNLARIRRDVAEACDRAGRSEADVSVVAVTKTADLDTIKTLVEIGLTDLAESRVEQLVERAEALAPYLRRRQGDLLPVRWHMIGHLQRNKVKPVLEVARVIHSLDSLRLAEEINARAEQAGRVVDALLQVNCSNEAQKSGCAVGAAGHLAELVSTLKHVRLIGLMTMAELSKDPEHSRPAFALLREIFDELRHHHVGGEAFRHLSMGMSQDYAVAVEEGATMLRIGTALLE